MGRNELALAQYRKGLEVNSGNLTFRREEAFHLNRLGRVDEAIVKIENLLNDYPNDSEAIAISGPHLQGNVGRFMEEYQLTRTNALKSAFDSYHWLIKSVDIYLKGFQH